MNIGPKQTEKGKKEPKCPHQESTAMNTLVYFYAHFSSLWPYAVSNFISSFFPEHEELEFSKNIPLLFNLLPIFHNFK